jgi:hypothetical protein
MGSENASRTDRTDRMNELPPIFDELQDSFAPLSLGDIARFERKHGMTLPGAYVSFLLTHNGGWFYHDVSCPVKEFLGAGPNYFFAIGAAREGEPFADLGRNLRGMKGRMPENMLPIADCANNLALLSVSGPTTGAVYVWVRDEEVLSVEVGDGFRWRPVGLAPIGSNMYLVADTIEDYFARLRPYAELRQLEIAHALPLFRLVQAGEKEKLVEALERGTPVDARDDEGHTLLMCAAESRWPRLVQLLLERGADVAAQDDDGRTALHYAAENYSIDSLKLLIAAGTDVNARDHNGVTVLGASEEQSQRVARILRQHGAVP